MESPVRSGIEMIEGDSPESIVSSQELDTPPWWAALLKQHTRHLQFDDSAALPISLLGQGRLAIRLLMSVLLKTYHIEDSTPLQSLLGLISDWFRDLWEWL